MGSRGSLASKNTSFSIGSSGMLAHPVKHISIAAVVDNDRNKFLIMFPPVRNFSTPVSRP